MTDQKQIPIFPLQLTVLPGESLLLHIFEDRYKQMITDCLALQAKGLPSHFGIIQSMPEGLASVGSLMKIERMLEKLDNGCFNLIAKGGERFSIVETVHETVHEKLYHSATIETHKDTEPDWDEELANQAFNLHRYLVKALRLENWNEELYNGVTNLSYIIGNYAALGAADKQQLLELQSENKRLELICQHLQTIIPQIEAIDAMKFEIHQKWDLL